MTKYNVSLLSLPPELLVSIASHFDDFQDLLNFSQACWKMRESSLSLVFKNVYIPWHLMELFVEYSPVWIYNCTSLHITRSSSYHEWHSTKHLSRIINMCPLVQAMEISLSETSSCLQYFEGVDGINRLTLISDKSTWISNNLPLLTINHLHKFQSLSHLTLVEFHVAIYSDELTPNVTQLKLVNCIWTYPTSISELSQLEHLEIIYDSINSFTREYK